MTAPDSFVEQAVRLADEMVAVAAFQPGGFAAARSNLLAHLTRQAARCAQLEEALKDAATSLETLSRLSGKTHYHTEGELIETFMGTLPEIRHYALSRAGYARSALSAPKEQST